jgi:hypothetical protein
MSKVRKKLKMDHSVQTPFLNSDSHMKIIALFFYFKTQLNTKQLSDLTEIPRRTLGSRPAAARGFSDSMALVDLRTEWQHHHTLTDVD